MAMTFATDIEASGSRHVGTADNRFTFNGSGLPVYYVVGPSTDTTAGTWTGTIDGLTAYYEGLTVLYRPAVAGASTTTLNINEIGAITCYYTGTSKLTTHYAVGSIILLTFYNNGWRRADYDSNTNTLIRVYRQTTGYNADYPIIVSRNATIGTAGTNNSYTAVYGVISDTSENVPTVNPSTGLVKFKGLTVTDTITGNISGDAGTVNGLTVQTAVPTNALFTDTYPCAYCNTAAGTAAKVASCTDYALTANTWLHVLIVNANSYNGAITLNVNSKGAKTIYINGTVSSSSNKTLPAGTYLVYYNGTNYYFRTDGNITATTSVGSASGWSAGSVPTLGTAISADDITAWTTNTPTAVTKKTVVTSASGATATYANGIATFTNGSFSTGDSVTVTAGTAASLSYTSRSIPNVTNVGTAPSLTITSTTVATGKGV